MNKPAQPHPFSALSAHQVSAAIYGKMTFMQKLEQVCKLRETAWAMKAAGVRMQHPEWTEQEVHNHVRTIFLYATT